MTYFTMGWGLRRDLTSINNIQIEFPCGLIFEREHHRSIHFQADPLEKCFLKNKNGFSFLIVNFCPHSSFRPNSVFWSSPSALMSLQNWMERAALQTNMKNIWPVHKVFQMLHGGILIMCSKQNRPSDTIAIQYWAIVHHTASASAGAGIETGSQSETQSSIHLEAGD